MVVLTNNDGQVVAVCGIAKRLGLKKFVPYFQAKEQLGAAGAIVRSSNYELYADLSQRMMDTCARFAPEMHIYSIDEAFLFYGAYKPPGQTWYEHARLIRRTVWDEVRLPTGVGVGPTPTLAKAASHAAKRIDGFRGLAVIDGDTVRRHVLSNMLVTDVWGIGKRIGARLNDLGIIDALTLSEQDPRRMRRRFSILVENTVLELNGEVRMSWDEVRSPKKEIFSTRSFGNRITERAELKAALAAHAEIVGAKLRRQASVAGAMMIFASNSPHDKTGFQRKSTHISFTIPTSDTRALLAAISSAMDQLFRSGIPYYRCGVGLLDISPMHRQQFDLFHPTPDDRGLMACMDTINGRYGRNTMHLAAKGFDQKFSMRREFLSPQYTTRWRDIPIIRCE